MVICPARGIEPLRLPVAWRQPLATQRLLILSPFASHQRRPTEVLAEQRNRFVATLADNIFMAYAAPDSRTAELATELVTDSEVFTTSESVNAVLRALIATMPKVPTQ